MPCRRCLLAVILASSLLQQAAALEFETIYFDELSPGVVVTTQYASRGVTLSLVPSPKYPGSPLPPPAGPASWSLGGVGQYGFGGNSIVTGPTAGGPFYDVLIQFSRPIGEFVIRALGAAGVPVTATAYAGAVQIARNPYLHGNINLPPYITGQAYIVAFSEGTPVDRVLISGAQQLDHLEFMVAARYEVTGSGSILFELPGYVGESHFSYTKIVDWSELPNYDIPVEHLESTVNGVTTSPGSGSAELDENGYMTGANFFGGAFEWGFSFERADKDVWVNANGLSCVFGDRSGYNGPECSEMELLGFDFQSDIRELADVDLDLKASVVAGCKSVSGTVSLLRPAPAGGRVVNLSDTLLSTSLPATVTVPAGASSKTFTIKTVPVTAAESGFVNATLDGGPAVAQRLTVRPMGILSLGLAPNTVVGSNSVTGTAKLECNAGPGPVTVDLTSSNPSVANPVATNIVVPQGLQSGTFTVTTTPVQSKSSTTIKATANEISKSRTLSVISAASVSPTSLKFGDQVIGTTSGSLTATVYNKGAVPYSILGITLTGTNAKHFAQSNNCPANLAAGAVCTIGVRFKPTVAGSKTASLEISTSAKSIPLKVYPSGTGVSP